MGLDMYLEARKYFSKVSFTQISISETPLPDYQKIASLFPPNADEFGESTGATIDLTIGYWRKANQIHAWFVRECGGGVDECQRTPVRDGKLRELKVVIEFLLDIKDLPTAGDEIEKLLPTQSGFFFGSTEIDEYYWNDLRRTLDILNKAIELEEQYGCSIAYQASW
jgi:hypothetical protein